MITTTAWVPRGFAAPFPTKYNFDEEEFERIANLAKLQLDDAKEDLEEAQEKEEEPGKKEKPSAKDDDASESVALLHTISRTFANTTAASRLTTI
jgi:periodic tryptophan protein 1